MAADTYTSESTRYEITVNGQAADGKRHPVVVFVHGNYGLGAPYGDQIRGFARDLNRLGYVTAVPSYYADGAPHLADQAPHTQALTDAIAAVTSRPDADPNRLGLIGFSLGAATAMSYVASQPPGAVKALGDFFGFLTPAIEAAASRFPPTIILHNKDDQIVSVENSRSLDRRIPATIDHERIEYEEHTEPGKHAFQPGGEADAKSRAATTQWFVTHLPPAAT